MGSGVWSTQPPGEQVAGNGVVEKLSAVESGKIAGQLAIIWVIVRRVIGKN